MPAQASWAPEGPLGNGGAGGPSALRKETCPPPSSQHRGQGPFCALCPLRASVGHHGHRCVRGRGDVQAARKSILKGVSATYMVVECIRDLLLKTSIRDFSKRSFYFGKSLALKGSFPGRAQTPRHHFSLLRPVPLLLPGGLVTLTAALVGRCHPLQAFSGFLPLLPSSCSRMDSASHSIITFVSSGLGQFLSLGSFLVTSTVLRSCGQGFDRRSFNLGYAGAFLMIRLGLWVFERAWHVAEDCPTAFSSLGTIPTVPTIFSGSQAQRRGVRCPPPGVGTASIYCQKSLVKRSSPFSPIYILIQQ